MKKLLSLLLFGLFAIGSVCAQGEVRFPPSNIGSFGASAGSILSADVNGGTTFLTPAQAAVNLNYWGSNASGLYRLNGLVGIGSDNPKGLLHIGNMATTNSNDPAINVARYLNPSSSISYHGFSESSRLTFGSNKAFAAFDARSTLDSVGSYDHYVSFQSAPYLLPSFSGTIANVYGAYVTTLAHGGTITDNYGVFVANPSKAGTGAITRNYGVYIQPQLAGTNNYSLVSPGSGKSSFGGDLLLTSGARLGLTTGVDFTPDRQIEIRSSFNADVGLRIHQLGRVWWELVNSGGSNDLTLNTLTGEKFRFRYADGALVSQALAGSVSGIPQVGSDGAITRSSLIYDGANNRLALSSSAMTPDQDFEIRKNADVTFRMYRNGMNYWTQTANLDWTLGDVAGTKIWVTNAGSGRFGIGNSPSARLDVAAGGIRFRDFTIPGNVLSISNASGDLSSVAPSSLAFSQLTGTGTRMVTTTPTGSLSFADLSVSTSSSLVNLTAQSTRNLRMGSGGATLTLATGTDRSLTIRDDGSVSLHTGLTSDPASSFAASIWYRADADANAGRFRLRKASTTATISEVETDVVGTAPTAYSANFTLGADGAFIVIADANTSTVTVTLDATMREGIDYIVSCRRNATNAITFDAATGYNLDASGQSALNDDPFTASAHAVYYVRRVGTNIIVK